MNLLFWRHKKDKHIIKNDCYNKLPDSHQIHYERTDEQPTHYVDNTDYVTPILIAEMLSSSDSDSGASIPDSAPAQDSFSGFGGGDFGGGGSSDSFDTPDSSSSYDSGSIYDSGSSYDSSSSSSDY